MKMLHKNTHFTLKYILINFFRLIYTYMMKVYCYSKRHLIFKSNKNVIKYEFNKYPLHKFVYLLFKLDADFYFADTLHDVKYSAPFTRHLNHYYKLFKT